MWLCRTVDATTSPIDEAKEYLARIGRAAERNCWSLAFRLIRCSPLQSADPMPASNWGSTQPRVVILISAGGYGIGPSSNCERLLALQRPWQIVAIAGKSEKTKKRLEEMAREAGKLPIRFAQTLCCRIHERNG